MRRMFLGATVGLLLATTVAFAHGFDGKAVKEVSATFTATAATDLRTSTCTGADGSYAKSRATYSGSAASAEPSLNGPARIEAASFVNTTTGVGTVLSSIVCVIAASAKYQRTRSRREPSCASSV